MDSCLAVLSGSGHSQTFGIHKQSDMNLCPVFVLLLSFGTKFTTNFSKIFVLNEGKRTKMGYGFIYLQIYLKHARRVD